MKYLITLFFMDGKDLEIRVPVENIGRFLESIGKNEVYFDDEKGHGIWLPIDKVRYFTIVKPTNGEK